MKILKSLLCIAMAGTMLAVAADPIRPILAEAKAHLKAKKEKST